MPLPLVPATLSRGRALRAPVEATLTLASGDTASFGLRAVPEPLELRSHTSGHLAAGLHATQIASNTPDIVQAISTLAPAVVPPGGLARPAPGPTRISNLVLPRIGPHASSIRTSAIHQRQDRHAWVCSKRPRARRWLVEPGLPVVGPGLSQRGLAGSDQDASNPWCRGRWIDAHLP